MQETTFYDYIVLNNIKSRLVSNFQEYTLDRETDKPLEGKGN